MNHLKIFLCTVFIVSGMFSCDNDDYLINCEGSDGLKIGFVGKIYANDPFHNYFYIGPLDNPNGGRIPCNELPERFKKEGLTVKVEGIEKGSPPDTDDPNYGYILITNIEEHDE